MKRAWILVGALAILRLAWIAVCPLDLVADEAYYWDWSRRPDWGYFSKPPMVAWINALSTGLLGIHAAALRLPAVLFGTLSMATVLALARRMFSARAALWSVALLAAMPGGVVLNTLMTIDAPLVGFWTLALYTAWRALENGNADLRWWAASGLLTGLGLLTKQMMIAFPIILLAYLAIMPGKRRHLRRPGPYLMLAIGFCALVPVLWWNAKHAWITFHHTAHHFEPHGRPWHFAFNSLGHFLGGQLLVLSPVIAILLGIVGSCLLVRIRRLPTAAAYLLLLGPVPLLLFTAASFRQLINANWPAVFHVPGMILLAAWGTGALPTSRRLARLRGWLKPAIAVGAGFCILTYALPFITTGLRLDGGRYDPTRRLRGWSALGKEMTRVMETLPRPDQTFLITTRRQEASELAFHMARHPQVFVWNPEPQHKRTQYDLWDTPLKHIGWDALILVPHGRPLHFVMAGRFKDAQSMGTISVPTGTEGSRDYDLYRGIDLRRWL